jgi:hypothetical protein
MNTRLLQTVLFLVAVSISKVFGNEGYTPLPAVPEGELTPSPSGAYLYLFSEVYPSATKCLIKKIILTVNNKEFVYDVSNLARIAKPLNGSIHRNAENIILSYGTVVRWRLPLPESLDRITEMKLTVTQYDDIDQLGYFKISFNPELENALPIFILTATNDSQKNWIQCQVVLRSKEIAKLQTGSLWRIPGEIIAEALKPPDAVNP